MKMLFPLLLISLSTTNAIAQDYAAPVSYTHLTLPTIYSV